MATIPSLAEVKTYLRIFHTEEDAKIAGMIPRAQYWVEDYTGIALTRREFTEHRTPERGAIRLYRRPVVSVDSIAYPDTDGVEQAVTDFALVEAVLLTNGGWPGLRRHQAFTVTYTAGLAEGEIDDRLVGAMLALIEGEFSDGMAYPARATAAAARCCDFLRGQVA